MIRFSSRDRSVVLGKPRSYR